MLKNENVEQYIWRLGQAKDSGELDMGWDDIADIVNKEIGNDGVPYTESTFRKPYQQAKRFYDAGVFADEGGVCEARANTVTAGHKSVTSINKDGTYSSSKLIEMSESESKDPRYILEAHGFDADKWQIVSAKNSVWQQSSKRDGVIDLYSSSITVKPIADDDISLDRMGEFFDRLDRNYSVPKITENKSYLDGDKLLLIDIADLHMNLQASVFTTGNEYNCDIAEALFFKVIEDVVTRTREYDLDEIVFCIGGDMLNADNLKGTTTKGTEQVNDVHYYDAYERLCSMTIRAIDALRDICKVNVIYVTGNHDEVSGFKLAKYVDAWFRNDDMVSVDYRPVPRKYMLYGKTLFCFAHDGKTNKLPSIIADEARELWSRAETTEVFLQHLHTEQVLMEENNMRIQRLPTISAKSKWSTDQGYGSKRQCKTFVFDKEDGLTDVLYTPIRNV